MQAFSGDDPAKIWDQSWLLILVRNVSSFIGGGAGKLQRKGKETKNTANGICLSMKFETKSSGKEDLEEKDRKVLREEIKEIESNESL